MAQSMPQVQSKYVNFVGGLDLVTPNVAIEAGKMVSCENFESDQNGGYRRIDGYERFDGRTSPSSAVYYHIPCSGITGVVAGNTITGNTSGATGVVIAVEANALVFAQPTGTFISGEAIKVGVPTVATSTSVASESGSDNPKLHSQYVNLAADVYRALIAAPAGFGSVLGVWVYQGTVYCFKNNAISTAVNMFKSSSTGWQQVNFEYEISFTNANISVEEGDTLTQGGMTATIRRVCVQSGSLVSGVNTGRLVISIPSGGNFAAGAATSTGAGALTLSGVQTAITLAVGGRFEFTNYDFGLGLRMYGADGVNRAFEFDGTYFCPISTGMVVDAPKFIAAHKNHLFLTFDNSLQQSGISTPFTWTVISGAAELSLGDTITGIAPQSGDATSGALACYTRNKAFVLYGTNSADWSLTLLQPDSGALPYSIAAMGVTYVFDDRGITQLGATQQFGNFQQATISAIIQPLIAVQKSLVKAATVSKNLNQLRYFFDDYSGLYLTLISNNLVGITRVAFPEQINCITSQEDANGDEVIYFGATDGMVYQMNKGTSFDGADITAFFRTPYYPFGTPRLRKNFKRAIVEFRANDYMEVLVSPDIEYGSYEVSQQPETTMTMVGGSATWDISSWDSMMWDGQSVSTMNVDMTGTSENMSFVFYTSSDYFKPFVINSAIVNYIQRRQMR